MRQSVATASKRWGEVIRASQSMGMRSPTSRKRKGKLKTPPARKRLRRLRKSGSVQKVSLTLRVRPFCRER